MVIERKILSLPFPFEPLESGDDIGDSFEEEGEGEDDDWDGGWIT